MKRMEKRKAKQDSLLVKVTIINTIVATISTIVTLIIFIASK